MELLGDLGLMEPRFGLFGDSVSVSSFGHSTNFQSR
jgi:hypothetical protein